MSTTDDTPSILRTPVTPAPTPTNSILSTANNQALPTSLLAGVNTNGQIGSLIAPTGLASGITVANSTAAGTTLTVTNPTGAAVQPVATAVPSGTNPLTTTTPAQNGPTVQALLTSAIQPNVLNQFYQVVPHFKLIVTPDKDLYVASGSPSNIGGMISGLAKLPQVIIAETGVSGYNIRDVVIESQVGPNFLTKNTNATKFTITITEPMGVSFLDAVRLASEGFNSYNNHKCFYYLTLSFRAYNTDGTINLNPCASLNLQNGGLWVYQIQIVNIDVSLESGGGTYTLTCIPFCESALDDDLLRTQDFMTISGATAGAMLNDLATQMSVSLSRRYGGSLVTYQPPVIHPIQNAPNSVAGRDPAQYQILSGDQLRSNLRHLDMDSSLGSATATLPAGSSLYDTIDLIFASTKEGQEACLTATT